LFLKELDGTERRLVPNGVSTFLRNTSWSPDGRFLAYTTQTGSQHDIWVLAAGDKPDPQPLLNAPFAEHSPSFAPDGRWLAYVSDESGRAEVYVRRYPRGDRLAVSAAGGMGPRWSRDGKEIFFQGQHDGEFAMMAVSVTATADTVRLGTPTPLFPLRAPGPTGAQEQYGRSSNGGHRYDVLPDGRFVMIRGADPQGTREIVLVQNWFEELRRLAGTR
jgi:Tol biopolymer transport system component